MHIQIRYIKFLILFAITVTILIGPQYAHADLLITPKGGRLVLSKGGVAKGIELHNQGKYREAIKYYDRVLERLEKMEKKQKLTSPWYKQKYLEPWYHKGRALNKLGRYQEAIKFYDRVMEVNPDRVNITHYDVLVERDKRQCQFNWSRRLVGDGLAKYRSGLYQEAISNYFNRALYLDRNNAYAWNGKGRALNKLGKHQEAIECYEKALKINPKCAAMAWSNKGLALHKLSRHQEAIDSINKSLELDPKNAYAWSGKGWVLGKMGGPPEEEFTCYEKALEIDPKHVPDWSENGGPLLELPRYIKVRKARIRANQLGDKTSPKEKLPLLADVIKLKSGREITGKIIEKDDEKIIIELEGTSLTFYRDEIKSIYQEDETLKEGSISFKFSTDLTEEGTQGEITMPPSSSDPRKWQRAIERYSSLHIPELKESANVEVNNSSDVAVMREMLMNLVMGLMSCMVEITRELHKSGMDEKDIDNFLTEKENETQKACLCENKSVLSELFKKMDSVLTKHPDWRGKTLLVKTGGSGGGSGTEKIDIGWLGEIKEFISKCNN